MFNLSLSYFKGFYLSVLILVGIMLMGTAGYIYIEGYTILDAWYMTLITVTTVGFQEVQPLSSEGKIFTSFLILCSFGTFAYAASSIGAGILSGKYRYYFRNYKLIQQIQLLDNHVIICGYGNNGEAAAHHLSQHNIPYVVLEKDPSKLEKLKQVKDILFFEGDAIDEINFEKVGIRKACSLITTLPSDADNVFVVLSARQYNDRMTIVSRATNPKSEAKLRFAGANNVIMPDRVGGSHMASLITTPDMNEFLDKLSITGSDSVNMEEVVYSKELGNKITIRDIEMFQSSNIRAIGIKRKGEGYVLNPSQSTEIAHGDKVFVLGHSDHVKSLRAYFG